MSDQNDPNQQPPEGQNPWVKQLMIWGGIFLALLLVVSLFSNAGQPQGTEIRYSDFREQVQEGKIESVQLGDDLITGTYKNGQAFTAIPVGSDIEITVLLEDNEVKFTGKQREQPNMLLYILLNSLPFQLILGIAFFALRQVQKGGGGGAMGFGKSKAKLLTARQGRVTFEDVAGIGGIEIDIAALTIRA